MAPQEHAGCDVEDPDAKVGCPVQISERFARVCQELTIQLDGLGSIRCQLQAQAIDLVFEPIHNLIERRIGGRSRERGGTAYWAVDLCGSGHHSTHLCLAHEL